MDDRRAVTSLKWLDEISKSAEGQIEPYEMKEDSWLMSGFVDTHIHAPQYINAGTALDKPLEDWLMAYTFKAESLVDANAATLGRKVYRKLVDRMVESGTTLASVFGTLSVEANMELARAFQERGVRGHIGKVNMDRNGLESYIETTQISIERTLGFIEAMGKLVQDLPRHERLVEPVITPRFVPTCTDELLSELGKIARESNLRVQSHMCESAGQVEWSKHLSGGETDVQVLHKHDLLNSRSLMAHCTHSSESDLELLASATQSGASISHCPLSNVYFSAERQLPLREALEMDIAVGLGSDISGGYALGIDNSMRWAVGVSRLRQGQRVSESDVGGASRSKAITWKESLYLATLGGARAMGMDGLTGSLEVGKAFDAQLIELGRPGSRVDWFDLDEWVASPKTPDDKLEELIEKWWCNGREEDRKGVWVQGRRLHWLE